MEKSQWGCHLRGDAAVIASARGFVRDMETKLRYQSPSLDYPKR